MGESSRHRRRARSRQVLSRCSPPALSSSLSRQGAGSRPGFGVRKQRHAGPRTTHKRPLAGVGRPVRVHAFARDVKCIIVVMLTPLVLLALMQSADIPVAQRGSDLFHSCQANLRALDSPSPVSNIDLGPAMACQAYISGFLDGFSMADDKLVCVDENATVGTISRIYVAFMEANPKLMDEPKISGFYQALAVNYTCPDILNPPKEGKYKK